MCQPSFRTPIPARSQSLFLICCLAGRDTASPFFTTFYDPIMTTQTLNSNVHESRPTLLRSSLKRPPPLNPDDLEPLLSASLKVQFSPALLSPHVHFPRTPPPTSPFANRTSKGLDRKSPIVTITAYSNNDDDKSKLKVVECEQVQYAVETTKLPADVPTATFDHSKFSSSDSSASDSDDYTAVKPRQRSVRFSIPAPISPIPRARTKEEIDRAMSFLPHPLSPYAGSPRMNSKAGSHPKTKNSHRPMELFVPKPGHLDVPQFDPPGLAGLAKLSPVEESPRTPAVTIECPSGDEASDSTVSTLNNAFWGSVSVESSPVEENKALNSLSDSPLPRVLRDSLMDSLKGSLKVNHPAMPAPALLSPQVSSPYPLFLFGRNDATFWTPEVPRVKSRMRHSNRMDGQSPFSPATTAIIASAFNSMTSPAPNDPAFPTIATTLEAMDMDTDTMGMFTPGVDLRDPPSPRERIY
jgi:hypothetical protein